MMRVEALPLGGVPRFRDRIAEHWFDMRDALLRNSAFQRWAVGFPLTRPIARRRTQSLFDVCAGFVYSQILLACVQLDVCGHLQGGAQSVDRLAATLHLSPDAAIRLLEAAAALELVERRSDGRFGLGVLGSALVSNPGIIAMIRHHALLYDDLRDPVGVLRGEAGRSALGQFWPYAGRTDPIALEPDAVAAYTDLMAASQSLIADHILTAHDMRRHRCLLDVGGGDGSFLIAAASASPKLQVMLYDLPPVVERARARFAAAAIDGRSTIVGGDFHSDRLPPGADIISLIRVIHDHDDNEALAILRAAHGSLPPGGTVLLAEPMAGIKSAKRAAAYFTFYLLAMGSGHPRQPAELARMLRYAGFDQVRRLPAQQPLLVQAMIATKKDT